MDSGPNLVHPHNLYTTRLSEERLSVSLTGGGVVIVWDTELEFSVAFNFN
jgi:hypothetical protein